MPDPVSGPLECLSCHRPLGGNLRRKVRQLMRYRALTLRLPSFGAESVQGPTSMRQLPDNASRTRRSQQGLGRGTHPGKLQTAKLLGFLANEEALIQTAHLAGWNRLRTGAGQVFAKTEA